MSLGALQDAASSLESELADLMRPEVALGGAVLMAVSLSMVPAVIALVRRLAPGRNVFFARWGFSHVAQALLVFFVASLAVATIVPVEQREESIGWALGSASFVFLCVSVFVMFLARRLDPDGIPSLGLRFEKNGRAFLAGLAAYLLLAPGLFGAAMAWPWTLEQLGESYEPQVFGSLFEQATQGELILGVVLAVLIQPFFEELLFRGFLQPLLVQNFRDAGGVVLTSLLFALPHGPSSFLPIFSLSLVLGGIMLRTQRLLAVWGLHALHNGLQVLALLNSV